MYRLRAFRSTPRMSFLRRATVALCRAISSRIGGVKVVRGGLLDMTGGGPGASPHPPPPESEGEAAIGLQFSLVSLGFCSPCSPSCRASLKFRIPAPSPRASSGIFLPPKIRSRITKMSISSGTPIEPIEVYLQAIHLRRRSGDSQSGPPPTHQGGRPPRTVGEPDGPGRMPRALSQVREPLGGGRMSRLLPSRRV